MRTSGWFLNKSNVHFFHFIVSKNCICIYVYAYSYKNSDYFSCTFAIFQFMYVLFNLSMENGITLVFAHTPVDFSSLLGNLPMLLAIFNYMSYVYA